MGAGLTSLKIEENHAEYRGDKRPWEEDGSQHRQPFHGVGVLLAGLCYAALICYHCDHLQIDDRLAMSNNARKLEESEQKCCPSRQEETSPTAFLWIFNRSMVVCA